MAYSQMTLAQFVSQVGVVMGDPTAKYWTASEVQSATWEALRVWGGSTNYWRTRGTFNLDPSQPHPYYDLSVKLPLLRTRSYNLNQMVLEIQYMLLEKPSGVVGTGMSGQISIQQILTAIQYARDKFVLDTHLPISYHSSIGSPSPVGQVSFSQSSVYVHRAAWMDTYTGAWSNLWREDAWAIDKNDPTWTIEMDRPLAYSEAENSPLVMQLYPPPSNVGVLEALTVDSLAMVDPLGTFGIPDEWVHAVKYAALNQILSAESQIKDDLRAQYADQRYKQAVTFAKDAGSVIRLMLNGVPVSVDSLAAVDAGYPYWRNQVGTPQMFGVLYDIVVPSPGVPDSAYSVTADVVQSAPLPGSGDYLQVGEEIIDTLMQYVCHVLTFKCGGSEFKTTMSGYDQFMKGVAGRKAIDATKVKYLSALFRQPQAEWSQRPDRTEVASA